MRTQHRTWIVLPIIGLIVLTMACAVSGAIPETATPTVTATLNVFPAVSSLAATATPALGITTGGSAIGTGGNTGGTGGNSGSSGGSSSGAGGSNSGSNPGNTTNLPEITAGPFVVKQVMTVGGEVISGVVCDLAKPFTVNSVTPRISFVFVFTPQDANHGSVAYSYSIPSAGESHDAKGTYTIGPANTSGTRQLMMAVSDHVVFKGFDGNIPSTYMFNLVPSSTATCPSTP